MTIALASALLSAIVLYGFGVMQETQNRNQKTAQIMYHAISEQQGQELYKQEEIAWVGEFFNAFSEQVNHSTVNFTYANADMLKSQSMPYSGDLPALENEIVVQESFLDSLGYSNELGQTIQIPFSDGTTHDFKLTGILDVKTGDIGRYTAIISKELVRQQYGDEGMIDYYIGLKGAQNMSEEEATNYANTLAQQLKISDDNVIVRSTYFNLKDENHGSDMLFYFLDWFCNFHWFRHCDLFDFLYFSSQAVSVTMDSFAQSELQNGRSKRWFTARGNYLLPLLSRLVWLLEM